jgi:anaerobic selenocysteine-containing dehydrogenase
MNASPQRIRSSCPRDCYDGCGIILERRGATLRVLGDPDHPVSRGRLCGKCAVAYNGVWQDPGARLGHPLRRTGPKGSGRFERISWDEAIADIARRTRAIVDAHGAEAILHTHYSGTLSLLALLFPMRFFLRLGATEVDPDTICNAAGHVAWRTMFGSSGIGFDPRTAADARCIVVWGANPARSGPHTHRYWFAASGAAKVVVDPVRTETAAAADVHLQPRPGPDAALAFGLLHVLRREGRLDHAFIDAHTTGAREVLPLIEQATASWCATQTGVPAEQVERAARLYGAGPALLWAGQGLQRQPRGGNIMRAIGLLPALTGNIGRPGAGFYYLNDTPAIAGLDLERMAGAHLARRAPARISHMVFARELERTDRFRGLWVWNTNPLASAPRQSALRAAFAREDLFTVVIDCFQTDSADYADIVLPAAAFLEFDDLTFSYFHLHLGVQSKGREPPGEALPNQEIFRRLAAAMGFDEPELRQRDPELIAEMMAAMTIPGTFEQFRRRGWHVLAPDPVQFHADRKFATPSGRIEIASATWEAAGLPRAPDAGVDAAPRAGRFRLLTPASDLRLNDSYANDPALARQAGAAAVTVHPDDAAMLGIADGAAVRLDNETGSLALTARVAPLAPRGVLVAHKGRWPKREPAGANVNVLNPGAAADMGGSSAVHGTEVEVVKI